MIVQILIAVLAGFFGGFLREFVVRPLRGYREVRKQIAKDLIKYGDLIANPEIGNNERKDEAKRALRDDAAEIRAVVEDIPGYVFWAWFWVPKRSVMERIEGRLIRLSNSLHNGDARRNYLDRSKVRVLLELRN